MNIQPWWVDVALVAVTILYIIDGFRRGFFLVLTEVLGFLLSLILALFGYTWGAKLIMYGIDIPHSFANAAAFFAIWILAGLIYPLIARIGYRHIPQKVIQHSANKYLGFIPAVADALILAMVILPLLVALPLSAPIKNAVLQSKIGAPIARLSNRLDQNVENIFSPAVRDSLAFLTVHPKSDESIELKFHTADHSIDEDAETEMFRLVNTERLQAGLPTLTWNTKLRDAGRKYGEYMVEYGFFSHIGNDKSTPGTRADKLGIVYRVLGENLAFAPDVSYAHDGLMNSPGHRANILSKDYHKLGIGVIDAGMYGKMFVQEFSD